MRFEIYEIAWAMALVILSYMWAKKKKQMSKVQKEIVKLFEILLKG